MPVLREYTPSILLQSRILTDVIFPEVRRDSDSDSVYVLFYGTSVSKLFLSIDVLAISKRFRRKIISFFLPYCAFVVLYFVYAFNEIKQLKSLRLSNCNFDRFVPKGIDVFC